MKEYKYKQFTASIERNIHKGILKPGDKLPAIRTIKNEFGLSTSSVQSGYDYLVFKGLVTSIPRSGYIVAMQNSGKTAEQHPHFPPVARDAVFQKNIHLTSDRESYCEAGDFHVAAPSDLLIPQKLILRTMQELIREKGAALLRYYPANGSEALREQLSKRSAIHGAAIKPEELLITDGALQSLYIALAALTQAGDIVAVESPCVFSVLEAIASLRLKTIEIPVRHKEGFDTEYLALACSKNRIKAIVLTPNFHNPTGILLDDERKQHILSVAERHDIPVIENDIYGDLYFHGSRPSTIRNFDTTGLVITFSSYAKTLAPGIRLGWLATGRFLPEIEKLKFSLGRSVSPLNQELILKLLNTAGYDRHLRPFRRRLADQSVQMYNQFSRYFPNDAYASLPQGGYSIWCKLPPAADRSLFYKTCEKYRIRFTPGETFSFTGAYDFYFRMVYAQRISLSSLEALKQIGTSLQ